DDVEPRMALAGHEPLLAVQHPVVALAHRRGGHRAHVGPRAGLRHGPGFAMIAAEDGNDPPLALFGREDLPQLRGPAVDNHEAEAVRSLTTLLFERHLAEHREPGASSLLRHVEHREALRTRLPPH